MVRYIPPQTRVRSRLLVLRVKSAVISDSRSTPSPRPQTRRLAGYIYVLYIQVVSPATATRGSRVGLSCEYRQVVVCRFNRDRGPAHADGEVHTTPATRPAEASL